MEKPRADTWGEKQRHQGQICETRQCSPMIFNNLQGKARLLVIIQNKGYVMFCWHLRAMQPDPSPSSTSTSQRQILGVTTLSLIYLSKSFHQENNYFEISTVYSPHEFYFLFFYSQTQSFLLFPNYHFCSVICL